MEVKQAIERISKLKDSEIGPTEENVKQKVIVPLLELLGHKRENLEFEYRTRRGGKMDIFIKNVPGDCKVIIDAKNYKEDLNDHVEQIKEYTFDEAALLAVIANGTEIRIYSPLRGVAFEKSLLYSFKRQDLCKESVWNAFSDLLHYDNLATRKVLAKISEREREIRDAMVKEEHFKKELDDRISVIDGGIEIKEDEIEQLKSEKENLLKEAEAKVSEVWNMIGLPLDLFRYPTSVLTYAKTSMEQPYVETRKAGRVSLKELVDAALIGDGQPLYFHNTRTFKEEQAMVLASSSKLKYKNDNKIYSISKLAEILLKKHGFKHDDHGVAGPKYWKTADGKLLWDLNEVIRAKRGDRQ
jgi:predicted type IV restriction endonuclease